MFTIGELAKLTGLAVGTIRFYESKGILSATGRDNNNNRYYDDDIRAWAKFIVYLRETGMSINDIKDYKALLDQGDQTIPQRIEILNTQKAKVYQQIKAKQEQIRALDHKIERYQAGSTKHV